MSLDIDWSLLGPTDLRAHLVTLLNNTLSTAPRPSFIGPITVTSFDLGTVPPDVEIKDIRDVWRAFDEGDEDGDAEVEALLVASASAASPSRSDSRSSEAVAVAAERRRMNGFYYAESGLEDEGYEVLHPVDARYYPPSDMEAGHGHGHAHGGYGHGGGGGDDVSVISGFSPRNSIAAVGIGTAFHGLGVRDYSNGIMSPAVAASFFSSSQVHGSRGRGGENTRPPSAAFHAPAHTHTHTHPHAPGATSQSPPASPPAKAARSIEPKSSIPSLQLHLRVKHKSDLSLTLLTSLSINYPSPSFMSLPLKLSITGLSLAGDVVLAYSGDKHRIHICVVDDDHESGSSLTPIGQRLLPHLAIDSEIGHADAHVLKNVGKVERFIVDVVRKTLVDELVFPNFQTIAL